jgi:hypothetical protein
MQRGKNPVRPGKPKDTGAVKNDIEKREVDEERDTREAPGEGLVADAERLFDGNEAIVIFLAQITHQSAALAD